MTTQEMIDVMVAYGNGEEIEYVRVGNSSEWKTYPSGEPVWNWDSYKYRIKPKEPEMIEVFEVIIPHDFHESAYLIPVLLYEEKYILSTWTKTGRSFKVPKEYRTKL